MTLGRSVCVAVLMGTTLGVVTPVPAPLLGAAALLVGAALLMWPHRHLVCVVLAFSAAWWGATARDDALAPPPVSWLHAGEPLILTGVLQDDASTSEAGVRLDLLVAGRRVLTTVAGALAAEQVHAWRRGATVTAPIRLRALEITRNPGSPSAHWQQLTRRYDLLGSVKSGALVTVTSAPIAEQAAARARQHVRDVVARRLGSAPDAVPAIVTAILIGDRTAIDDGLSRRLQAAGVFHVIAISGGNVAMLAAMCLMLCRVVFRSVRPALLTAAVVVAAYGYVVGPDPSVSRAVAAALVYFGLQTLALAPDRLSLFAAVAAGNALVSPLVVVDVGAWLSFGATFGLLLVLPALWRAVTGPSLDVSTIVRAVRVALVGGVLASVAAELVILPVSVGVFHRVGIAGLVLNLLAIPAMALVQFGGLLMCVLDAVDVGADVAGRLTRAGVRGLLATADVIELAPWLSWRVPPAPAWMSGLYLLAGLLTVLLPSAWWRRRVGVAYVVLLAGMLTAPLTFMARPAAGWLRVTMLDVGQGDSTLVQLPSGQTLLIDAGGSPAGTFDVGGRVVTPAVWALGTRRLDWLLLTHGDLDHIGGAASVVDDLQPREVWEGIPVETDVAMHTLRRRLADAGAVWRRLLVGQQIESGGVTITVRHPPMPDWQRVRVRNDDSVVIDVVYGRVSILLTGDAGVEFERGTGATSLVPPPSQLRILKAGHHGSRTSTSAAFVDGWRPHVALISAGAGNLFGHPAPIVLETLARRGVTVYRTDQHGATIVETDGARVHVRPMVGPSWWGR